jgi:hypothetical protein
MEEMTFICITYPKQNTPVPGTEHIKTLEEAQEWLEINQEYIPNEDTSNGHEFRSKYILLQKPTIGHLSKL